MQSFNGEILSYFVETFTYSIFLYMDEYPPPEKNRLKCANQLLIYTNK